MPQSPEHQGPPRPAVFLDRDDTINENATLPPEAFPGTPGDLYLPDHVRLLPGAAEACRRLKDAGYLLVIVTNQGGVARGHATEADIHATNRRLCELLGPGVVDACYSAPHHPEAPIDAYRADHPWRKPNPGMVTTAAKELHIDLARSWLVGDKDRDLHAAIAAGIPELRCLLVGPKSTSYPDLPAAADHILAHTEGDLSSPASPPPGAQTDTLHRTPESGPVSTATLTASYGAPLADDQTRRTVHAAAEAIAERTGIDIQSLSLTDNAVTVTLATHPLGATAFLAELRRSTNAWHHAKHGTDLWPTTG